MNLDFHYYGTYYAARLAGFDAGDAETIAYYAQFVDECSKDALMNMNNIDVFTEFKPTPTVQSDSEMGKITANPFHLNPQQKKDITQIWSTFHFLPGNVNFDIPYNGPTKSGFFSTKWEYESSKNDFKLLCLPNSELALAMVENLKDAYFEAGKSLSATASAKQRKMCEAIGMAMHVLADTWAHCWFAGAPAWFINDVPDGMLEIIETSEGQKKVPIRFMYDPIFADNLDKNHYACTARNTRCDSMFYLGHGRVGHLPDYSFMSYEYTPQWDSAPGLKRIKSNPEFFMNAFRQMVYAMKCVKENKKFEPNKFEAISQATENAISSVINTRKRDSSNEWKQAISRDYGIALADFSSEKCFKEYNEAGNRQDTTLYRFLKAACEQVTLVKSYELF